ncbi:hypothetical protein LEMLEM_LOCUS21322 [Lemmus lemmus]
MSSASVSMETYDSFLEKKCPLKYSEQLDNSGYTLSIVLQSRCANFHASQEIWEAHIFIAY